MKYIVKSFPIAVISSTFNYFISNKLKLSAISRLYEYGFKKKDIVLITVPGSVEIPIITQCIAKKRIVRIIITLGVIIQGDTDHYNYVCQQVSYGCQRVALDYNIPVIFGILTTRNAQQALDRINGKQGKKGIELVDSAMNMYSNIQYINTL